MPHNSIHAFGKKLKQRTTKWDLFHIAFAILLSFMSSAHLFWGWSSCLSPQGLIILVDTYLGVCLVLAALSIPEPLPARQTALLTVPCLFLVLIMSFASCYLANGHIEHGTTGTDVEYLSDPWDSVYFSTVTITTLGYGDWVPSETGGRCIVIGELLSGAMLLLFLFPLLASRLALFDEPSGGLTTIGITRLKNGGWRIEQPRQLIQTLDKSEEILLRVHADGSVTPSK